VAYGKRLIDRLFKMKKKKFKYLIYLVIYFILIILMGVYFYKEGIGLI